MTYHFATDIVSYYFMTVSLHMDDSKTQFVRNLLAYSAQRDVSPEQLCKYAGLDFKALKSKEPVTISDKHFNDLWLNAVNLSSDALFGLHFGESLQLSALGIVGQIIQASKTIGEALSFASGSTHFITDMVTMKVNRSAGKIIVLFFPDDEKLRQFPESLKQFMDFFMVFTIHEMDGLVLQKIRPTTATLHSSAVDIKEYKRVLRCAPKRKPGICSLTFTDTFWNEPIITANYELQQILMKMNMPPSTKKLLLSERILDHLNTNAYLGIATLEDVAANFNSTPHTLQRKLREEGINFQQLSDSVRKAIAMHYLQSGNHPVKEISHLLGYNEISAFTRAFKRWTGKAPVEFQKE